MRPLCELSIRFKVIKYILFYLIFFLQKIVGKVLHIARECEFTKLAPFENEALLPAKRGQFSLSPKCHADEEILEESNILKKSSKDHTQNLPLILSVRNIVSIRGGHTGGNILGGFWLSKEKNAAKTSPQVEAQKTAAPASIMVVNAPMASSVVEDKVSTSEEEWVTDRPKSAGQGTPLIRTVRKALGHPRLKKTADTVQHYFSEVLEHLPRLVVEANPTCSLKIRKRISPLRLVTVTLGVDYCFQLGTYRFTGECEDNVLGMKLNMVGSELQATKIMKFKVFASEEKVAKLKVLAAYDFTTMKGYGRISVRSERLTNFDLRQFLVPMMFNLDNAGRSKLEVKTDFHLPEPEIAFTTEQNPMDQKIFSGMDNIQISVNEINFVIDL